MYEPPTCQFEHELSPCDGGKVFISGDSEADTYRYCRRHYKVVRLLRKDADRALAAAASVPGAQQVLSW